MFGFLSSFNISLGKTLLGYSFRIKPVTQFDLHLVELAGELERILAIGLWSHVAATNLFRQRTLLRYGFSAGREKRRDDDRPLTVIPVIS